MRTTNQMNAAHNQVQAAFAEIGRAFFAAFIGLEIAVAIDARAEKDAAYQDEMRRS